MDKVLVGMVFKDIIYVNINVCEYIVEKVFEVMWIILVKKLDGNVVEIIVDLDSYVDNYLCILYIIIKVNNVIKKILVI